MKNIIYKMIDHIPMAVHGALAHRLTVFDWLNKISIGLAYQPEITLLGLWCAAAVGFIIRK